MKNMFTNLSEQPNWIGQQPLIQSTFPNHTCTEQGPHQPARVCRKHLASCDALNIRSRNSYDELQRQPAVFLTPRPAGRTSAYTESQTMLLITIVTARNALEPIYNDEQHL